MDSTREAKEIRRLAELLQEQQEPFTLGSYLSERGCDSSRRSWMNGGKNQKKRGTSWFSKMLRSLCDAVVVVHGGTRRNKKPSRSRQGACSRVCRNAREAVELERFSSASSTTVFNSCSDSDPVERPNPVCNGQAPSGGGSSQCSDEPRDGEVNTEKNNQRTSRNKNKQPSIVSATTRDSSVEHSNDRPQQQVLQVFSAWHEVYDVTACRLGPPKKTTEESLSSSAYTFDILFHCKQDGTGFAQSTKPRGRKTAHDHLSSKRVLQQRRQLLFDCVKEVIESYEREDKARKYKNSATEREEVGKIIIYEKMVGWGRTQTNVDELLCSYYSETEEEWRDYAKHRMKISLEVGDALMEDISDEIVADLICH